MHTEQSSAATKRCIKCDIEQPIQEYRRVKKNQDQPRKGTCRKCHNRNESERLQSIRDGSFHQVSQQLNRDFYLGRRQNVVRVIDGLVLQFGSPERVAEAWYSAIQSAKHANKNHLVIRSYMAIIYLLRHIAEQEQRMMESFDVEGLNEDEVAELLSADFETWAQNRPEFVAQMLAAAGWHVERVESQAPDEHQ